MAARGGGVDMDGMWVGTIGGGDGDKDDRDDIEDGVVTREVSSLVSASFGVSATGCLTSASL